MKRIIFNLLREPRKAAYEMLIDASFKFCNTFLLVAKDGVNSLGVLKSLEPFLVKKSKENEWPGTKSTNPELVFRFRLEEGSSQILKEAVDRLYGWQQPTHPEDLCFLRPDGSPWFVSISHEFESYFEMTQEEKDLFSAQVPEIGPLVKESVDSDLWVNPKLNINEKIVHVIYGSNEEVQDIEWTAKSRGFRWFQADVSGIKNEMDFFHLIWTVFEFPLPFDPSWNSIIVSLRDMSWLPGKWYVFHLDHADRFLNSSPETFEKFLNVAEEVSNYWWELKVPFHFFLSGDDSLFQYDYGNLGDQICFHSQGKEN
jgi:hypothetical protein